MQSSVSTSLTEWTRRQAPVSIPPSRFTKPGSNPVPMKVAPPSRAAASSRSRIPPPKFVPVRYPFDVVTTFAPLRKNASTISTSSCAAMNDTQSGRSRAARQRRRSHGLRYPPFPRAAGIDADFVRRVNVHTHEIELWMIDNGGERSSTDLAGRPLHDPIGPISLPSTELDVDSASIESWRPLDMRRCDS